MKKFWWYLPAGFGGNPRPTRVPRTAFKLPLDVQPMPAGAGLFDPLQLLGAGLWQDYWTGPKPPADGEPKTGTVACSTFHAYHGSKFVVRIQSEGEPDAEYLVDLSFLTHQILMAHLERTGKGKLQRARIKEGELEKLKVDLTNPDTA